MHVKSLTLRGFKSFADATSLEFEPGVTVVVGPNGSGKSNVVDAVAWVLGAQGPRVVRSAKMDDVIFAGTARRPALGRAEVSLTIDNSSRRLPVDLAEVTITRTLFRTGESEYSMNGAPCRLLDIQEMLSDAGVGRTQHVIMSQGQLASVLDARPEERRAVIEEAAGILKFRRRRERAERRLESTEANLQRLQDLLREVRRQLRPLERQAEAARRHGALQSELHALRLHLAGRELDSLRRRIAENDGSRAELAENEMRLSSELGRLDGEVARGEAALDAEQRSDVLDRLGRAERLAERARGVANVLSERRRRVEAALTSATEADVVAALDAESARIARELEAVEQEALAFEPEREELDRRSAGHAREMAALDSSRDDPAAEAVSPSRAERDAVLAELGVARERLAATSERRRADLERHAELLAVRGELEAALDELRRRLDLLAVEIEATEAAERTAAARVTASESEARSARERAEGLRARARVLAEALDEASARAGVEQLADLDGVLGTLLDVVEVDAGFQLAFEAAAEESLSAVVVESGGSGRAAVDRLRQLGASGSVLPLPSHAGRASSPVPESSLRRHVHGRTDGSEALLDALLEHVVVCTSGLAEALEIAEEAPPGVVVVTTDGDRFSARGWRVGAGRVGATRSALESAEAEAARAATTAAEASQAAETARREWSEAREEAARAGRLGAAARAEHDQIAARLEEQVGRLGELGGLLPQLASLEERDRGRVEELSARLATCEDALRLAEEGEAARRAAEADRDAHRRQLEEWGSEIARLRSDLAIRQAAVTERRNMLVGRRAEIESRLEGYETERAGAVARRRQHERSERALRRLTAVVSVLLAEIERAADSITAERSRHDERVEALAAALTGARTDRVTTERELSSLRERAQRAELERTELLVRLETSLETLRRDLDCEPDVAIDAPCPELPPGTPPAARLRELERELRLLGPVNPLALEELAALEERDRFLSAQLEDVRQTRRELGRVIKAVDEEIVSVFSDAFSEVSSHFEELFATLFPGGSGRLSLAEPDDLLSSGVEIEARPAGRNVRRLTLLSGGERSLVALAFLFAVFRSRPSPFYLMDEVEAALDDVNLHRFLDLVDEFRHEAQLIIVSHQKRTMESADVIYGVSMQPGGASKVVSERLGDAKERTPASV